MVKHDFWISYIVAAVVKLRVFALAPALVVVWECGMSSYSVVSNAITRKLLATQSQQFWEADKCEGLIKTTYHTESFTTMLLYKNQQRQLVVDREPISSI